MDSIIKDGTGTGSTLQIDTENRLRGLVDSQPLDKHINIDKGKLWSAYFQVTPTGANDYFFYFKNTGTEDLFITDIRISSSAATQVTYEKVTGTASSGTAATVTNRNFSSAKTMTSTIEYGVDITGLTSAGVLFFEECVNANQLYHLKTTSNIIITPDTAIAFKRVAASGSITCIVSIQGSDI